MDQAKNIILLMGPKGAGKTYLAARMEAELGIPFLRVEPIWLALSAEMAPGSLEFDNEGQRRVLANAQTLLSANSQLVLESTGTAPWFANFLAGLKEMATVTLVRVRVPLAMCLERIHARDATQHIAVSDDRIGEINEIACRLDLPWSATVDNVSVDEANAFIASVRAGALDQTTKPDPTGLP